ncbi:hypothetical protein JIN78_16700 [Roseibacillus ishigakijimensis]|uniref:Uncharacterized protein n=3 Tax=Roseibacillus ishigakijimensis TaxID=454146 RepID=A0A934RRN5_9BACT|nr:hypothetical protein [Roseibacillus ishigakijimensis]
MKSAIVSLIVAFSVTFVAAQTLQTEAPSIKITGNCLKMTTSGQQVYLIPLSKIVSVKISPFYEDNIGEPDEEVKGYVEIATTALTKDSSSEGVTSVSKIHRLENINFMQAKQFGDSIAHALAQYGSQDAN